MSQIATESTKSPASVSASGVALPQDLAAPDPRVFYRIVLSRVSFKECWWGTRNLTAVLVWLLLKVFRMPVPGSSDDPAVESLEDFEVADVDPGVYQKFEPLARDLASLGFNTPIYHEIDDKLHSTKTFMASFAHPTLPVVARIHIRIWEIRTPAKYSLFTEFITAYPHGEFLWTLSSKADVKAPPACRIVRKFGAPPLELWKAHEAARAGLALQAAPLRASNPEQVRKIVESLHAKVRDFHLKRGFFAPLTAENRARLAAAAAPQGGTPSQYPQVLAEISALQNKKTSWRGGVVLLIISLIVFLGVGLPGQTKFVRLLALAPILLFHELGHFLAMKAFGYRNLRMFFIPGFGAAVTGRAYNVPGWKKVVVSLMGPVPGIVVGILLGVSGMVWHKPLLIEGAFLTVLVNGLNLIPVLPFDGGHVVHTLLFSRFYVLDIVFRAAAALTLATVGIIYNDRILLFITFVLFGGIAHAVRVGKVARELRKEGLSSVSWDDQSIPPEIAERIITKLKSSAKKSVPNKLLAQQTISVFETLNARPPGWFAGLGLGSVHLVGFAAAVIFAFVFAMAGNGAIGQFLRTAAQAPQHTVAAAEIRSAGRPADAAPGTTIVATFAKKGGAAAAYADVRGRLGPQEQATLYGDTLLLRVPATDDEARTRWLAELQPRAQDVFADGGTMQAVFRFQCVAPTDAAATDIYSELKEHFDLPHTEGLRAPWSTSGALTAENLRARKTYVRLESIQTFDDPQMMAMQKQVLAAQRQGDTAQFKALTAQQTELLENLRRQEIQKIVDDTSGGVDTEMARQYLELNKELKPDEFYEAVPRKFAARLGQMMVDGRPDPESARSGYVSRAGLLISVEYVSFIEPAAGVTAMNRWLAAGGCAAMRYEVHGSGDADDDP